MLWNVFTALHLTLASKIYCLKGIALQFCQDDKYSFVAVDMLFKYFYSRRKETEKYSYHGV